MKEGDNDDQEDPDFEGYDCNFRLDLIWGCCINQGLSVRSKVLFAVAGVHLQSR